MDTFIKPFPLVKFPAMGYHLFNKSVHKSGYVEIIKGKNICINRKNPGMAHVDGEPIVMGTEIKIEIKPLSLSILC